MAESPAPRCLLCSKVSSDICCVSLPELRKPARGNELRLSVQSELSQAVSNARAAKSVDMGLGAFKTLR